MSLLEGRILTNALLLLVVLLSIGPGCLPFLLPKGLGWLPLLLQKGLRWLLLFCSWRLIVLPLREEGTPPQTTVQPIAGGKPPNRYRHETDVAGAVDEGSRDLCVHSMARQGYCTHQPPWLQNMSVYRLVEVAWYMYPINNLHVWCTRAKVS